MRSHLLSLVLLPVVACSAFAQGAAPGLKTPPGFEVVEFADSKLANDIHCMTIDPKGRIVVAGRGYIRILVDDNGDGRADRTLDFASEPKDGAMGMLWEGDTLYVTGDGGLRQFTSKSGDRADGPSHRIRAMKTAGEHTSHAIRRGPDGWLYVLGGNTAGVNRSYAELPTSPVKEPIAGCVLRFQPDLEKCEIVAHGFRNPYGMDFNLDGELFTYDSDNERCVSLPWYELTRFYHVIEGRHYGWLNPQHAVTWRRPPYFCDVVAPVCTLGRGSPTGVVCYAHNQFPPDYHGGFFLCDWTFGKVHHVKLTRSGATYTGEPRVFLESIGDHGFAPTAVAVEPRTGDLYVSIGGRGTRGAVYRVRHTERFKMLAKELAPLKMATRSLDWNDATKKEYEQKLWSRSAADHLRALQIARRQNAFVGQTGVTSPFETRHYFDDLCVRQAQADLMSDLLQHISPRQARAFKDALRNNIQLPQLTSFGLGILQSDRGGTLDAGLSLLARSKIAARRLEAVRLVQLALGDIGVRSSIGTIWEGYTPRQPIADDATAKRLAAAFPSGDANLDRELARTLGMLAYTDAGFRSRLLAKCDEASTPIDDIHYLACYARLPGTRAATEATRVAALLLDLDRKIAAGKLHRDSNWPPRVRELVEGLSEKDGTLYHAMLTHGAFGRPDHALFATAKRFPRQKAASIFLDHWKRNGAYALSGTIVQLFETLPPGDVLPTLRERWGETGQETALLTILARAPQAEDRRKLLDGLKTAGVLDACVAGLNKLDARPDAAEIFALTHALHRLSDKQSATRNLLADRLVKITGQKLGSDSKRWIAWLEKQHPEFGKRLANPDGVDVAKWDARLARLSWEQGNADAGKLVFARASCVNCHSGSQAVGPDLAGAAGRFSRADLFTAILQPSKDVSARYQTTIAETRDGKTYQGVIIYDAVDNLLLQTPTATVRIEGAAVVSRSTSPQSLMPAGLLDPLSDRDIVDLYAYLRSLTGSPK